MRRHTQSKLYLIPEILAALQIAVSPFLIGVGMGVAAWFLLGDTLGLLLACLFPLAGLIAGMWWVIRIWKREGAVHFMSRIIGTPQPDMRKADDPNF